MLTIFRISHDQLTHYWQKQISYPIALCQVGSNVLYRFGVDNLPLSYPFRIEPKRLLFNKVITNTIRNLHIYLTDAFVGPVDLNNVEMCLTLVLRNDGAE